MARDPWRKRVRTRSLTKSRVMRRAGRSIKAACAKGDAWRRARHDLGRARVTSQMDSAKAEDGRGLAALEVEWSVAITHPADPEGPSTYQQSSSGRWPLDRRSLASALKILFHYDRWS
jgi:hypothetical protein